jgi:2-amino-4-hydroxy-6-hydroxymethyldihydropteridine diphosphokinase
VSQAYIGIGSNLGASARQVAQAIEELDALADTRVASRSSLYRSAPVGYANQPDFVNAVVRLETGLPAGQLLSEMQEIEARHGRERPFPNAPRSLDLDLLLFDDVRLDTDRLVLPHPRMHERAFVLKPLLEIAGGISIPGQGAAEALLARCRDQAVEKLG